MASKKKSSFVNMVVVLFIVSAVAATVLAFVYQATKEPIAKAKLEKKKSAIGQVLPEFDTIFDPISNMFKIALSESDSLECYPTKKDGKICGYAIKANTNKGFSGEFWIMVGFTPDGKIYKTAVLEHHETPGLGDKMQKNKSDWSEQFTNLNISEIKDTDGDGILIEVTKDQGTIDAITAATISSRGFCDACERARNAFNKIEK
ncbi:MAG: RnfABCDGE type electron transport complex subunit G [Bacteroidales bacterium]|nr:RnfABCDGE type electron transport complex subunit G [Bacteroidales bacterium]